jgi:serine protease
LNKTQRLRALFFFLVPNLHSATAHAVVQVVRQGTVCVVQHNIGACRTIMQQMKLVFGDCVRFSTFGGAAVCALAMLCAFAAKAEPSEPKPKPKPTASGLIVKLKPTAQEGRLQSVTQVQARFGRLSRLSVAAGYTGAMPWRHLNGQTIVLPTPSALTPALQKKLIERLMASGQVEWVEPNVREPLAAPSDRTFNQNQWWLGDGTLGSRGLPGVQAAWAHVINTNDLTSALARRTVVGVLDTGKQTHADLPASQFLPGYDFVSNPSFAGDRDTDGAGGGWDSDATDPGDSVSTDEARQYDFLRAGCGPNEGDSWHGATVAAIVAANGASGYNVKGVNPTARILPVRVAGKCGADLADIVAGMYWAAGLSVPAPIVQQERDNAKIGGYVASTAPATGSVTPARVINISFGGADACGNVYQEAVNALRTALVSVVAAAGNEHSVVARPGNCSGVIAVAALNRAGFKSTYSNFGSQITVSTLGGDPGKNASAGYTDAGAWESALGDGGLYGILPVPNELSTVSYADLAGTSYSAPIVAGVVSLMLDVYPDLTPLQVETGLRASAKPHVTSTQIGQCSDQNPGRCICTTTTCGAGVVDADEAIQYALALKRGQRYERSSSMVAIRLDDEGGVATAILSAKRLTLQDRPANAAGADNPSNSAASMGGSGGGGGAIGWPEVWALIALLALAWHLNPRKQ